MTNTTGIDSKILLAFLQRVRELTRDAGAPIDIRPLMHAVDDLAGTFLASDIVVELRNRGLLFCRNGLHDTTSSADRLLDEINAMGAQLLEEFRACEYTFSHTSAWCGNPYCR